MSDTQLERALERGAIDLDVFCTKFEHLHFLDEGMVSLRQIFQHATDLAQTIAPLPLRAVFIDHAGLIKPARGTSAYERASEIGRGLKQLARRLNVPVFCVVQANRAGRNDDDPVPLESARDSGSFEENSDFVISFGAVVDVPGELSTLKVRLTKNRRGPMLPAVLTFDPVTLRMGELADEAHRRD